MNYPFLKEGDSLPAVGVLQKLLNRTGEHLNPDGVFGPLTKAAVMRFQRARHLAVDGKVGVETWPRLVSSTNLPIIDCIDVFDPSLAELEEQDIRHAGGNPIVIGGMCNGVAQAVVDIIAAGTNVFLLRLHGHGAPGVASISSGRGELDPRMIERADITLGNFRDIQRVISRLRWIFGPYGCVEFMHCETGSGHDGHQLLQQIADTLGVPASAGIYTQYGGGLDTFKFEGPTHTAVPGGGPLSFWCHRIPDFAHFTPA